MSNLHTYQLHEMDTYTETLTHYIGEGRDMYTPRYCAKNFSEHSQLTTCCTVCDYHHDLLLIEDR